MSSPFKIDFKVENYHYLFPEQPEDKNEIINYDIEDTYEHIWRRQIPPNGKVNIVWLDLEIKRIRQGAWILIKGVLLWLPPQYYFFLQYALVKNEDGGRYAQFRLKKLKQYYFKEDARRNKNCIGTITIKNRRDGESVSVMSDILWEMQGGAGGLHRSGQIGIQSKTSEDAYDPCYRYLIGNYQALPDFIKKIFYSDVVNPKHIDNRLRFESSGEDGRNVYASYFGSTDTAMDGREMLLCVLDEIAKWEQNSLLNTFSVYKKFILEGTIRKGMFVMFSSPSETNGRCNQECHELWQLSDVNDLQENGTTKSRLHRWFSNCLEGISGEFDRYGDADPKAIYKKIMADRANVPKTQLLNEIRGYPLNESEAFASGDGGMEWDNMAGLRERLTVVENTIYKNEDTLEPTVMYGNLEWKGGVIDSEVVFRPNPDGNFFCIHKGRFCFSELPNWDKPLDNLFKPPQYIDSCLGLDPFHLGKGTKLNKGSNAGACAYKFREAGNLDFAPRPTCTYNCRPLHIHILFEDMLKLSLFTRSPLDYEKSSDEIERYYEDRGYILWVLNRKNGKYASRADIQRGKGGGAFLTEMLGVINIITNKPIDPSEPYNLDHYWFAELIRQIIDFDRMNTTVSDLFMGYARAVLGAMKIMSVKQRNISNEAKAMMDYLMS